MTGRLFLIVGPSGAGKDTVIAGAMARLRPTDDVILARRMITRPLHSGGAEQHIPVSPAAFARLRAAGAFALDWDSHGLSYGIGAEVQPWLDAGMTVIANGSRAALPAARRVFGAALVATEITARPEVLAARLVARGRESAADIAERLARSRGLAPAPVHLSIPNDGTPAQAAALLLAAIQKDGPTCA
ncbi:phosphonate metabolism protein/1,5-bisphosphokinase (PRPP-forming) PhnN [Yoonia sp.]|uniref:phosphonate metabolism protein/1,5-bisphosphokinase (PRPP-forming) PhnN n=1 Tax=Yoonia sp. TaxID=2212373 RepID=UPI001A09263C|nr:phosphonate metabolism protein/1,5-bisphosphokinase (PRPP-forming) PhnN [Yoonia sp.]MBE0413696.1 phosphonate metabolism protein/1,5-bisphosphokinase (PRPP-forming) PhnN [Yoonia sp.]